MFKNLKLGSKIGFSFFAVLALLSIVLGISITALQKADEGIEQYQGLARHTNLAGLLQANMLMMGISQKDFLLTQSDQDLQLFHAYLSKINEFLNEAKKQIKKPSLTSSVASIDDSIKSYEDAFEEIVTLIKQRNEISSDHLVHHGEIMRETIAELIQSANNIGDSEATFFASLVQEKMLVGRLFVVKFLQSNSEQDFNIAIENMEKALKLEIIKLEEIIYNASHIDLLDKFKTAHVEYIQDMNAIQQLITSENTIEDETLNKVGLAVAKDVENMKLSIMEDQETLGPVLKKNIDNSVKFTLLLSAIAIAIGLIAAFFVTRSITKPIQKAVAAANQLAEGDLTIDIGETSKDETGLLLNAIQNTASNLRNMITTISGASIELASASEELAVVTEQSAQGIVKQETETDLVATAMNEMAATVHDVADNAASAADAANKADNEANSGSQVVEQTIMAINTLTDSVNHSSEKLSEVEIEVNNISNILNVIGEIADQTNLLALNAAIEAARAGEQGRGFAVVADEVRSLAGRTQVSTQEIQNIIEKLQTGTKTTVAVMDQGKAQAGQCVEQANETSTALLGITNAISVINDMNIQIASASEQQSLVAESINENVINVKKIAEENAAASSQTQSSSGEIAQLAEQLKQLVVEFKV